MLRLSGQRSQHTSSSEQYMRRHWCQAAAVQHSDGDTSATDTQDRQQKEPAAPTAAAAAAATAVPRACCAQCCHQDPLRPLPPLLPLLLLHQATTALCLCQQALHLAPLPARVQVALGVEGTLAGQSQLDLQGRRQARLLSMTVHCTASYCMGCDSTLCVQGASLRNTA